MFGKKKDKGPTPFKIWMEETNYTGKKNKKIVYTFFVVGLMLGFALGILTNF